MYHAPPTQSGPSLPAVTPPPPQSKVEELSFSDLATFKLRISRRHLRGYIKLFPALNRDPNFKLYNANIDQQSTRADVASKCSVMFVGPHDCDKRMVVQSMINSLLSVEYNEQFRYILPPAVDRGVPTAYEIPATSGTALHSSAMRITDFPCFGDTAEMHDEAETNVHEFQTFCQAVKYSNAICFVAKASDTTISIRPNRLDQLRKYKHKLFYIFTACDDDEPAALDAVNALDLPVAHWFAINDLGFELPSPHGRRYYDSAVDAFYDIFSALPKITLRSQLKQQRRQMRVAAAQEKDSENKPILDKASHGVEQKDSVSDTDLETAHDAHGSLELGKEIKTKKHMRNNSLRAELLGELHAAQIMYKIKNQQKKQMQISNDKSVSVVETAPMSVMRFPLSNEQLKMLTDERHLRMLYEAINGGPYGTISIDKGLLTLNVSTDAPNYHPIHELEIRLGPLLTIDEITQIRQEIAQEIPLKKIARENRLGDVGKMNTQLFFDNMMRTVRKPVPFFLHDAHGTKDRPSVCYLHIRMDRLCWSDQNQEYSIRLTDIEDVRLGKCSQVLSRRGCADECCFVVTLSGMKLSLSSKTPISMFVAHLNGLVRHFKNQIRFAKNAHMSPIGMGFRGFTFDHLRAQMKAEYELADSCRPFISGSHVRADSVPKEFDAIFNGRGRSASSSSNCSSSSNSSSSSCSSTSSCSSSASSILEQISFQYDADMPEQIKNLRSKIPLAPVRQQTDNAETDTEHVDCEDAADETGHTRAEQADDDSSK